MTAPSPVHPGAPVRQIAADVFFEGEVDHGVILHAPAHVIARVIKRLGWSQRPTRHAGQPLATLSLSARNSRRVEAMLSASTASTIPAPAECAEGR